MTLEILFTFFYKTRYSNEEVNSTEPHPSVSVPRSLSYAKKNKALDQVVVDDADADVDEKIFAWKSFDRKLFQMTIIITTLIAYCARRRSAESRVTRLGDFLPIGLLLEAHYDFLKR